MWIFCELRCIFPSPAGARKNTSNEQNVRSYYMLNHRIRGSLFHYKKNCYFAIGFYFFGKSIQKQTKKHKLLANGTQVKPCWSGLRTGWVTNNEYRLKGPYVVFSFLLLLFCVLCGVIFNSVLKSRFSIISASGFRKRQKQRTNMARCSSPENYYSSGRNALVTCRR